MLLLNRGVSRLRHQLLSAAWSRHMARYDPTAADVNEVTLRGVVQKTADPESNPGSFWLVTASPELIKQDRQHRSQSRHAIVVANKCEPGTLAYTRENVKKGAVVKVTGALAYFSTRNEGNKTKLVRILANTVAVCDDKYGSCIV